jgi:hypothetical protein
MTSRGKKIFIAVTVIVPFLIYSIIYYKEKFVYANFKAKDFVSFEYKWGIEKESENSYNSVTGAYQYHDNQDSLISKKVILTKADFKFLDSVADVQGFWNLPDILANTEADYKNPKILRYEMKFVYKNDTKSVVLLSNYNRNDRMRSAALQMQKTIEQQLADAEK